MDEIKEKSKFRLRLLIDEKRNKVVLAETCRDFVDLLFSFVTLPMGTIVRLLDKHQKLEPVSVGCFNNLYTSVSDMVVDDFETEACQSMLLYPRSSKEIHCRSLKLNIDDTEAHISGRGKVVQVSEEEQIGGSIGNVENGVFVSCRSSYIVTDDLRVTLSSLGVIGNVLKELGYADFDGLQEILLDAGFEELISILRASLISRSALNNGLSSVLH
ncbi:unnamed protein product [Thlaspi arvense]|uniref:Uncharacterized protein n=1 Tax=Thlaspi arvense TaxID=13288 RepID=A0AAU9T5H0_THLAR|nr:unnamed protein product [Thlaspi arvense]